MRIIVILLITFIHSFAFSQGDEWVIGAITEVGSGSHGCVTQPEVDCDQSVSFNGELCAWQVGTLPPIVDDGCEFTDDSYDPVTCEVFNIPNCIDGETFIAETCECVDPCSDPTGIGMTVFLDGTGIGVTGGTPPYTHILEQGVDRDCAITTGIQYGRLTTVDANGCQCVLHFVVDDENTVDNSCVEYNDLAGALAYYSNVSDLSIFAPNYGVSTSITANGVYSNEINISSDFLWSSECGTAPEPCPNLITEFGEGGIGFNPNTMIITLPSVGDYPFTWTITQTTGANAGQTYSGVATSGGSVIVPVIPDSGSNGQWLLEVQDNTGCTDSATYTASQHGCPFGATAGDFYCGDDGFGKVRFDWANTTGQVVLTDANFSYSPTIGSSSITLSFDDNTFNTTQTFTVTDESGCIIELIVEIGECCPDCPIAQDLAWRTRNNNATQWRVQIRDMNDVRNALSAFGTVTNEVRTYTVNGVVTALSGNDNQLIVLSDNTQPSVTINYSLTLTDADGCAWDYTTSITINESDVTTSGWSSITALPVDCDAIGVTANRDLKINKLFNIFKN